MMDGILNVATLRRQNTLLCTSYSWSDGSQNVSSLVDQRCDGLILVVPTHDTELVSILQAQGIPFVLLCAQDDNAAVTTVDVDNAAAAGCLTEQFIADGHRRIVFVYSSGEDQFTYCAERRRGCGEALAAHGLGEGHSWSLTGDDAYKQALARMRLPAQARPSVFFCATDVLALGLTTELQEAGWRVPEDVSVVGFDDISDAAAGRPPLTTVRQPLREIGELCAEMLLEQIHQGVPPGRKILLPTEIVWRESYAPHQ